MAAHRYWRVTGLLVQGHLELTDAMLLVGGSAPSPAPTLSATIAPNSGTLSTLLNGTTSDIVSWDASVVRSSGFALIFDCGVGGIDSPDLRLGAGSSRLTFPQDLLIQFSDDGTSWVNYQSYINLMYPGDLTLTSLVPDFTDPYFSNVVLLLNGDGTNNSTTFTDRSTPAKTVTSVNGAKISTTQSKFGGSSMFFDGTNDYLSVPASADFLPNADFTIEAWVYCPNTATGTTQRIAGFANTGGGDSSLILSLKGDGKLEFAAYNGSTYIFATSTSAVSSGTWVHLVGQRRSGNLEVWIAGSLACTPAAVTGTFIAPVSPLSIGRMGNYDGQYLLGYIDDLRITQGIARYSSAFTPPTAAAASPYTSLDLVRGIRFEPTIKAVAGADLEAFSAYSLKTIGYTASDMENGGTGRIYGTTKEKPNPSLPPTPLSRRVLLVDERSQLIIRETWSDAATGAFEFRDLALGRPYATISYDHLRNYRAAIADNQFPELQT